MTQEDQQICAIFDKNSILCSIDPTAILILSRSELPSALYIMQSALVQHNKKPLFVLGKVFCALLIGGGCKMCTKYSVCLGKKGNIMANNSVRKIFVWDVYEFSTDQI